MKFPVIIKSTFKKINCSPNPSPKVKQEIVFNMPETIQWGAELPVCGYLRVNEDLRIVKPHIYFRIKRGDEELKSIFGDPTLELGFPNIDINQEAYELIKKNSELYFNVNGQHPYRNLPPGNYEILLTYNDFFKSDVKKLKVKEEGWRHDFSQSLVKVACKGQLFSDLSDFFSEAHHGTLVDLDEVGQAKMLVLLAKAWEKGFASHRSLVTKDVKSHLGKIDKMDETIPYHSHKLAQKSCSAIKMDLNQWRVLYQGIKSYEI